MFLEVILTSNAKKPYMFVILRGWGRGPDPCPPPLQEVEQSEPKSCPKTKTADVFYRLLQGITVQLGTIRHREFGCNRIYEH